MKKELATGFLIGVLLYLFIFGVRVLKVLIKGRWRFDIIGHGLYVTFSSPAFVVQQVSILILCIAGSMTLYYFYKKGYFLQK